MSLSTLSTTKPSLNHPHKIKTTFQSISITHPPRPPPLPPPPPPPESVTKRLYWTKKIHQLCTTDNNVDEALRLLDSLRLRGYLPDSLNLSSIIHALCHSRRYAEAHHRFLLFLTPHSAPDERTCNVIVSRLLNSNNPQATLAVINRLVFVKPEYVPTLTIYNRLIDQICSASTPNEAHRLLFDMVWRGHCPNTVSYTALINGYCKVGDLGYAQKLFDEMSESGVRPNSLTYSVFIRGILWQRDVERAKKFMGKLWDVMEKEEDQLVNNAAFTNLVHALCREGLFHELFSIAESMCVPGGNWVSDEFAYGQMIDSLCKYQRYNGAARIVYMMRKRGFMPSLVSYNNIIHGLSKDRDCLRAYQLLEEGEGFGYRPSEYTYKILVEGLCRESDVCKAQEVVRIMLNKEGVDKTRIYNIYLKALCLMNNATELLNVLVLMLQRQCQPDVITLNTVIDGFCKMGKIEEALKVLEDMMLGKFCAPNSVTFTTVISGLLSVKRMKEAFDLFYNVMPKQDLSPNVVTYNALICGLFKLNHDKEAMEIFDSMVRNGVLADSTTYTIIIDGLFDADQMDEAKRFWDDVIWPSKVHDNYVYAAILKGLCHSNKFNEACDFMYELVNFGITLTIVNYNILIDNACKLGLKRSAYQIVGEMRKKGLEPDAVTWRVLDKLHVNARKRSFVQDASMKSKEGIQELNG